MPIRRDQVGLYPRDWKQISARIKARSGGRCECEGRCGLHHGRRCEERHGEPAKWAKGVVVLTVMHLNHDPTDNRDENLSAACQRCHNRYDQPHRKKNAAATRRAKKGVVEMDL